MALLSFDGDNAYKKYAETSISKKFKLVPIESIKIEGGEVSQDDIHLLVSSGLFTIDICGDIYSGLGILLNADKTLVLGDVEKYGVCILIKGGGESGKHTHTCLLDPKKYGKDLNASYYLRFYAEVSDLDVTNDYRFLVDKKRAVEFGEDAALIAAKPYIEETYDADGNLIGAKLYGYTFIRDSMYDSITTLKSIEMPDDISYIGAYAFLGCTSLALTSLPNGIMSIGEYAFEYCTSLALTSLPAGLTTIADETFQNCTNLALTSLPEGLTNIGQHAFFGCTSLALTSLPAGLTSIERYVFYGCTSLALTSLPAGVTSIGSQAFESCSSLALTSLPEGLTSIGAYAFQNCINLALTSLPAGLTSIERYVFSGCTNLTSITFKGTPITIDPSAFRNCTNLTDIKVPWAEGAVSGAPWSATNATITYNYTGA